MIEAQTSRGCDLAVADIERRQAATGDVVGPEGCVCRLVVGVIVIPVRAWGEGYSCTEANGWGWWQIAEGIVDLEAKPRLDDWGVESITFVGDWI